MKKRKKKKKKKKKEKKRKKKEKKEKKKKKRKKKKKKKRDERYTLKFIYLFFFIPSIELYSLSQKTKAQKKYSRWKIIYSVLPCLFPFHFSPPFLDLGFLFS